MRATQVLGRWGEEQAARHVVSLGWTVLDRNWRCPVGELDLVARQPDGTVVFIEVKTRSGRGYGDPLEAVTCAKVRKLHELALWWLREQNRPARKLRIDAIGLVRDREGIDLTHAQGITR
ncbi:YraN family protein [Aestuariimicrobium soli]|uniref:YraN family protein n=1 Tax=Aestuariimicrobium soli TaxID=2035834 RepID=UPI003EBB6D01